jgi:hypothetical protein
MLYRMKVPVVLLFCGLVAGLAQAVAVPVANASGGSDHGNTVTVVVTTRSRTPGQSGHAGGGSSGGHENVYVCTYTDAPPSMTTGLMTGGPEAGQFYIVTCTGPGLGSGQSAIVWLANQVYGIPEGVTPNTVAQRAASSITLPSPVIRTNPAASTVVNIPTWLWINSSIWHPRTATASLAGISATATASPVMVTFATGDGAHVVCYGPGTAYNPSEPPSTQRTSCSHSYSYSSAGQASPDGNANDDAFDISATITWNVTWKGDGFAGGGSLPALTTTSTTSLRVEQIESVQRS